MTDVLGLRRAPPAFRRMRLRDAERLTARMMLATFAGVELRGFDVPDPAASVRLLLPSPGRPELVIPEWAGNEFLLADGSRPVIRTFTPYRTDPVSGELDLMIVLHDGGAAASWAEAASPGDAAAVSGPGRGYEIDPRASQYLVVGDETAIPAIAQVLDALPDDMPVEGHVEIVRPDARLPLPGHPRAEVVWHTLPDGAPPGDTLVAAVEAAELDGEARVWAAGEAAGMQRIRKLLGARDFPRSQTNVRGYWKQR